MVFANLQRDKRSGERVKSEWWHDFCPIGSLWLSLSVPRRSRPWTAGPAGLWSLSSSRLSRRCFSFLRLRSWELLRFGVISCFLFLSDNDLHGDRSTIFFVKLSRFCEMLTHVTFMGTLVTCWLINPATGRINNGLDTIHSTTAFIIVSNCDYCSKHSIITSFASSRLFDPGLLPGCSISTRVSLFRFWTSFLRALHVDAISFLSTQAFYIASRDCHHHIGSGAVVSTFMFQSCRVHRFVDILNRKRSDAGLFNAIIDCDLIYSVVYQWSRGYYFVIASYDDDVLHGAGSRSGHHWETMTRRCSKSWTSQKKRNS